MKYSTARRLIKKIMKYDATSVGIFISVLSHTYIECCEITDKKFLTSLRNSLKTIREEKDEERNDICR